MGIHSNGSLEITLDAERLENVRGQICDVRNECQKYNEEINALDVQVCDYFDYLVEVYGEKYLFYILTLGVLVIAL